MPLAGYHKRMHLTDVHLIGIYLTSVHLTGVYCGRDKGMSNGRLYDREGMAMMESQSLETRFG